MRSYAVGEAVCCLVPGAKTISQGLGDYNIGKATEVDQLLRAHVFHAEVEHIKLDSTRNV